jgi:DNA processing protein
MAILKNAGISSYGVRVHGAGEYPLKLRDARYPIELLYFQGWWDFVESPCISIVGTRAPSEEGKSRAKKLTRWLVGKGYTIISGLARGIDTVAHTTAIHEGGKTIAVIGTPLSKTYPHENANLQKTISEEHLLISQVPVVRNSKHGPTFNRMFFPERNVTMSVLSEATIIVEAGETSGTLTQARAALQQGRKLFILDSCFLDEQLTWPKKYAEKGAVRVRDFDDIERHLAP